MWKDVDHHRFPLVISHVITLIHGWCGGEAELEVKLKSMKHPCALVKAQEQGQRSDAAAPITEKYEVMHKCQ